MNNNIIKIEEIIGYTFRNKKLLIKALTHTSFAHENDIESYQNMEFLGDSILDFVVAEHLIKLYPNYNEGELTQIRSTVVSKDPLANIIDYYGLDDYILISGTGNPSRKTRSDIFESLVAAIYYDSGMSSARDFIIRFLGKLMLGEKIETDHKSRLYEYAAKKGFEVEFVLNNVTGPQHRPTFYYEVRINDETMGYGEDHSKKAAQQEAARHALKKLD